MQLRPYQREAVASIFTYYRQHNGNPLVVCPTGAGKSVIIGSFVATVAKARPISRYLITSHRAKILAQNKDKLHSLMPGEPIGLWSAGLGSKSIERITVAGIDSIYRSAGRLGCIDFLIIDEAHLVSRKEGSKYGKLIATLKANNANLKIIGFTATPYRMDSGMLYEGEDRIFTDVAYEIPIKFLIENEFLSPLISKNSHVQTNTKGVKTRGGEFIESELEKVCIDDELVDSVTNEMLAYGVNRRSWLIFCAGVKHANIVRDTLRAKGVTCESITGEMPEAQRDRIIDSFQRGEVRAITNCDVLTTGSDIPCIDLLVLLRPTRSPNLYVQAVGRGTRLSPGTGKTDCLVADHGGNINRFGPIDDLVVRAKGKGKNDIGNAPVKTCPECECVSTIQARTCKECGFEFPFNERGSDLDIRKSDAEILSTGPKYHEVIGVSYTRHYKTGAPDSLKITYTLGGRTDTVSEWLCLEHDGFAQRKARALWYDRSTEKGSPVPETIAEALERSRELRTPSHITLRKAGRYYEIASILFDYVVNQSSAAA